METDNYYVKNQETGKLNVFTTKAFYDGLDLKQREMFTRFCLWSRKQECWISKGKADNCVYLQARLKDMGFINNGTLGERISFAEQVERQQAKAEGRVARSEKRAEQAEQKSDALLNKAREMASVIPLGQPTLVGHHSEKRDRNYRDKIHNTYGRAFEEKDKADYYKDKAEIAKYTAEGGKFKNPKYLGNRIKECEKNIRVLERRLKGKFYSYSPEKPISEETRLFYTTRLNEEKDKLDYFNNCMKSIGLNREDLKPVTAKKAAGKRKGLS